MKSNENIKFMTNNESFRKGQQITQELHEKSIETFYIDDEDTKLFRNKNNIIKFRATSMPKTSETLNEEYLLLELFDLWLIILK
jgi:hypothetical protein